MVDESSQPAAGHEPSQVHFHYIKAQSFRVIHVDGVIGGITPSGHIHCAVFSERPAIPQQKVHRVEADGTLGPELKDLEVSRGGIVREMDVDMVMTLEVAEALLTWLIDKVQRVRTRAISES